MKDDICSQGHLKVAYWNRPRETSRKGSIDADWDELNTYHSSMMSLYNVLHTISLIRTHYPKLNKVVIERME